ncbi:ankyrin repeat domain-containing protein [Streptomyces sp. NPDC005805]|uniref:ankyrin repeat domain-containing protein n=1 Tax=Streptomyces sp. NPDC005805 TaxID=3157068 RepID=UPI0033C74CFE
MLIIPLDDPLAVSVTGAIRTGDLPALRALLDGHPGLATARVDGNGGGRSLLHLATDWPGHIPDGPATVAALVAAGADPDARFTGAHAETPLHWAASCDDVPMIDALLAAGADIEAPGAVIGGGTPLADARGFGQWRAARRLVEHGARTTLHDAAALGLTDRVAEALAAEGPDRPDAEEVEGAFWSACHGGQLATARLLHAHGAHPDRVGYDDLTPVEIARAQEAGDVVAWLESLDPA